jgi:hypothetical protein
VKHQMVAALTALAFVAVALLTGAHRRGAVSGATISGLTGVGSLFAMARFGRGGGKVVQRALAVMALTFLLRILLVAIGTFAVVRAGESVVGFVAGFFIPYFVFSAIEGAFVHTLSRGTGPTA